MTAAEIEKQIFEKMRAKDFGESMCNETKRNVLRWVMQQLRLYDVISRNLNINNCNSLKRLRTIAYTLC